MDLESLNPPIALLSLYFFATGALEVFLPRLAEALYEKVLRQKNFQIFCLWAFALALLGYGGSPAPRLQWFLTFLIWFYGFMGIWILISPGSFRELYRRAFFSAPIAARYKIIFTDGLMRLAAAAVILWIAKTPK
jgi:hypothetical protein